MIAVIAMASVIAVVAPRIQDRGRGTTPPVSDDRHAEHSRVLGRDLRTLPEAPPGKWVDFDATKLQPSELPAGYAAVRDALRDGDVVRAIDSLQRVLEAVPDYPPALHQLGVLYFKLQRYSTGALALERFLRAVPSRVGETRVLAHCYYSLGEYEKAREHYELVLAAVPGELEALRGLALTYRRLGDEERALALLEDVLKSRPEHVDAWTWKAQILYERGRSADALVAAQRARDLDPFAPRAWYLIGQILIDLARTDEARVARARYEELSLLAQQAQSLETQLEYDPHHAGLLMELARVRVRAGDAARAKEVLSKLLTERAGDVRVHVFALNAMVDLGDAAGARIAARALETRCADEPDAWKRLEVYYASIKDVAKQLQAGERYRRLKSD